MMKMLRILLCALLLVIGGATAAVAAQGQPELMVPMKGTLVGQDEEPDLAATGCSQAGPELLWRFTSEGTGQVSHLGRVTYQFTHCTHVDGTLTEGMMTLAAANGDTLVLTYSGEITQYVPGDADAFWTMSWTPSSGTGRFADAGGSGGDGFAVTHTPTSPLAGTTDLTFQGMITYNASNRAAK